MIAHLDTHAAVWLHDGLVEKFSRSAIRVAPESIYGWLNANFGVELCQLPFSAVIHEARSLQWTYDPFDRILVAQAQANHHAPLITADGQIRTHYPPAVW